VSYEFKDKDGVRDLFEDRVDLLFKQFHDGTVVAMQLCTEFVTGDGGFVLRGGGASPALPTVFGDWGRYSRHEMRFRLHSWTIISVSLSETYYVN